MLYSSSVLRIASTISQRNLTYHQHHVSDVPLRLNAAPCVSFARLASRFFTLWNGSVMFEMMSLSNHKTERNNFLCTYLRKFHSLDLLTF